MIQSQTLSCVEHRRFQGGARRYVYIVPSAELFLLDGWAAQALDALPVDGLAISRGVLDRRVVKRGGDEEGQRLLEEALEELRQLGLWGPTEEMRLRSQPAPVPEQAPPVGNLVLNVAERCNMGCSYCFAEGGDYGQGDAIMGVDVAKQAIDFLFREAGDAQRVSITLFGGEPLLNLPVLREAVDYGYRKGKEAGKHVNFTMTTNATLLTEEVSRFLHDHDVGVTVSIDGPQEVHDAVRPFKSGRGSFALIKERLETFFEHYTVRPVGARVTVTRKSLAVRDTLEYLLGLGFHEVGFSPVHTLDPELALTPADQDQLLEEFRGTAERYVELTIEGRFYGFSNLTNILKQLHEGSGRPYPCGAGIGLVGVSETGDISLCHRFTGQPELRLGHVDGGFDVEVRQGMLEQLHVSKRGPCSTCWVRSLCGGGCHYVAHQASGGRLDQPPESYCDWIRAWIQMAIGAYCRLSEDRPDFLARMFEPDAYRRHVAASHGEAAPTPAAAVHQAAVERAAASAGSD